jgi:tRNA A-37 threonylcarbamoyl transferase component Bud32
MFLDDKLPPNAIVIEYIPNMKQIDLSNFSRQRVETFRDILFQMHQANILHGDPKPRNMMIAKNRILWIDFDSAQTFLENQALTSIQHKWFKEEVEMMEYFVEALVRFSKTGNVPLLTALQTQDFAEGKIKNTYSYYYDRFV